MKLYVNEKVEETVDGEKLQVVEVLVSKPKDVSYLIFLEK